MVIWLFFCISQSCGWQHGLTNGSFGKIGQFSKSRVRVCYSWRIKYVNGKTQAWLQAGAFGRRNRPTGQNWSRLLSGFSLTAFLVSFVYYLLYFVFWTLHSLVLGFFKPVCFSMVTTDWAGSLLQVSLLDGSNEIFLHTRSFCNSLQNSRTLFVC